MDDDGRDPVHHEFVGAFVRVCNALNWWVVGLRICNATYEWYNNEQQKHQFKRTKNEIAEKKGIDVENRKWSVKARSIITKAGHILEWSWGWCVGSQEYA